MKCAFCKGELELSTTEYIEKQENYIVIIENIPCRKCTQCGEAYLDDDTMSKLETILDSLQRVASSLTLTVIDYTEAA